MKLIVDIPDSDYTAVRCEALYYIGHEKLAESVTTAFQAAIPYGEPAGDLISRSYLKQTIPAPIEDEYKYVHQIIDNAPSVETDIEVVAKDAYEQGYTDGWKERYGEPDERPQGEWIDTGSGQECNVCHEIQYGYDNFRHFCANCGAKMKKGAQNEIN